MENLATTPSGNTDTAESLRVRANLMELQRDHATHEWHAARADLAAARKQLAAVETLAVEQPKPPYVLSDHGQKLWLVGYHSALDDIRAALHVPCRGDDNCTCDPPVAAGP